MTKKIPAVQSYHFAGDLVYRVGVVTRTLASTTTVIRVGCAPLMERRRRQGDPVRGLELAGGSTGGAAPPSPPID